MTTTTKEFELESYIENRIDPCIARDYPQAVRIDAIESLINGELQVVYRVSANDILLVSETHRYGLVISCELPEDKITFHAGEYRLALH